MYTARYQVLFQEWVQRYHHDSKLKKTLEIYEAFGLVVLMFSSVWKPVETRSTIIWNYFSNKESKFKLLFE